MIDRKMFLKVSLFVCTGISCSLFSKTFSSPTATPIPTPTESEQPTLYSLNDALTLAVQTIQAEESKTLVPATPIPIDLGPGSSLDIFCEHKVAFDETLTCIGRGYGVLPEAIAEANGIKMTTELQAGQMLQIPYVQWTNIPIGPVCLPQCTPPQCISPDIASNPTTQSPPDKKSEDTDEETDPRAESPATASPPTGGGGGAPEDILLDQIWTFEPSYCTDSTQQTICP